MKLLSLDIFLIVLYSAIIIGIGFIFSRKINTANEFMVARRNIPAWLIAFTIFSTYSSNVGFFCYAGRTYAGNWSNFVCNLALPFSAIFAVLFFIPFFRKQNRLSAFAHLEAKLGRWANVYATLAYVAMNAFRASSILYLMCLVIFPFLGISNVYLIIITGVIVITYTFFGGIEAVIWTDFLQGVLTFLGAFICLYFVFKLSVLDNWKEIFNIAYEHQKFDLGSFKFDFKSRNFWSIFCFGFLINIQNFGAAQAYVQRYWTAKSRKSASLGLCGGILLVILIAALTYLIGTLLFVFYKTQPEKLSGIVLEKPDAIVPFFIVNELPAGIKGLLLLTVLGAGMSSIDSILNSTSTLFLEDFLSKFSEKRYISEKKKIRFLHTISLLIGIVCIFLAIQLNRGCVSILETGWQISSVLGGGILGLFLLSLMPIKFNPKTTAFSLLIGLTIILWINCPKEYLDRMSLPYVFNKFWSPLIGSFTTIFFSLLFNFMLKFRNKKSN